MADRFLELRCGDEVFRARLISDQAPLISRQIWDKLPLRLQLIQDEWSGWIARSVRPVAGVRAGSRDATPPYQFPGLLLWEKRSHRIALCYGQGRLQDGFGPLEAVPFAQIGGDLRPLRALGQRLEYEGVKDAIIARARDQRSPLAEAPFERGRRIEVRLGTTRAGARLLEETSPVTAASFARAMPIDGSATNIPLNGPLVRLRTPIGAPRGGNDELALESDPREQNQTILYPGYVYYRGGVPSGIRIATREAAAMIGRGGVTTMTTIAMAPLARFEGDWSALREEAARLFIDGQKPLSFRLLDDGR